MQRDCWEWYSVLSKQKLRLYLFTENWYVTLTELPRILSVEKNLLFHPCLVDKKIFNQLVHLRYPRRRFTIYLTNFNRQAVLWFVGISLNYLGIILYVILSVYGINSINWLSWKLTLHKFSMHLDMVILPILTEKKYTFWKRS